MSDTLNALIDFLSDPETNGPEDLRARVAGMNETERREALARATREAHEMQAAVDHEVEVAATRERNRSLASHVRAQTDEVNSRFSAASRGTGIGPWVVNGLRHPIDTAASGIIALENLRRFLADQPGRYELAPSMQAEIDQGRVDAAAHPVSDLTGKIGGGYLLGAQLGLPQSFMSSPGYLTGIARYVGNVGLTAGTNAAQDAMASPDRPETFQESARDTLTSPWPWLVGLAGEGLGYAARNAQQNADMATRFRADSFGVHGGLQQALELSNEARGAEELAAMRGMSPEDFARRGEEANGIGRNIRDYESEIEFLGHHPTTHGDTIARSGIERSQKVGARLGELREDPRVQIDPMDIIQELRDEATHRSLSGQMGDVETARRIREIADRFERDTRRTVNRTGWVPVDDVDLTDIPYARYGETTDLARVGGPTRARPSPVLEQRTERVAGSPALSAEQVIANRRYLDDLRAQFRQAPRPGMGQAIDFSEDVLNGHVDDALGAIDPALRTEHRALSHEYGLLGGRAADTGLISLMKDRAASAPGAHLEAAAAAMAAGRPEVSAVRATAGNVLNSTLVANARANFNRELSDVGRLVGSTDTVGSEVIPAMRASQAFPSLQLPHLHLQGPGGQPEGTPSRQVAPLAGAGSSDGSISLDDIDHNGDFMPRQSAPSAMPTPPPATPVPRTLTLDDLDHNGDLLPGR